MPCRPLPCPMVVTTDPEYGCHVEVVGVGQEPTQGAARGKATRYAVRDNGRQAT